ncbi:hypothetical protein HNP38_002198 [Chryseobacterium defluvii]|uniref:Uncharacterized protein n=1 Tax=Chryseobacterium defluvii TaxID=160396 RepID=A0A840KJ43_9FLAO|nr:hypothetical protein [Chryseobacterium defluvii]MBB4806902.1 hypothetical protein [Chryseobacterium defluvii]
MATIQFHRPVGHPRNNTKAYIIKINGVKKTELFNRDTRAFEIREGLHEIKVKVSMDTAGSKSQKINVREGEVLKFEVIQNAGTMNLLSVFSILIFAVGALYSLFGSKFFLLLAIPLIVVAIPLLIEKNSNYLILKKVQ